jgi:hypothetical protein
MLSVQSAIREVPLSVKERRAIRLFGVSTVGDFLQLDLQRVWELHKFGNMDFQTSEQLPNNISPKSRRSFASARYSDFPGAN